MPRDFRCFTRALTTWADCATRPAMPSWLSNMLPIVVLLTAVGVVLWRLPKVDLGHSQAFKRRRIFNWLPLGLTYAFLYFARYNFKAMGTELETTGLLTKMLVTFSTDAKLPKVHRED